MEIVTLNIKDAAKMYGIKVSSLRLMCLKSEIKAKKVGRAWYVTKMVLDKTFT